MAVPPAKGLDEACVWLRKAALTPFPQTFPFLVVVQCERNSRERSGEAVYGRVKRGERGERGGRGQ